MTAKKHILENNPTVDMFCPICLRQKLDNEMRGSRYCSRCHNQISYGLVINLDNESLMFKQIL